MLNLRQIFRLSPRSELCVAPQSRELVAFDVSGQYKETEFMGH